MSNFLKINGYKHDQVKVVPLDRVIKPAVDKTLKELTKDIDRLNLLTIVLKKHDYIDNFFGDFEFQNEEYTCVDNHDLLLLRFLQGVKSVHAVVLESE